DGISYLLVVGDETVFEPEMRDDGGLYSCDNCYGYMEGDDHLPEILVGRFHAANAQQLAIMVSRNLAYEKSPDHDAANLGWGTGMWAASNEGQGIGDDGQADYEQANDWKEKQLADGYDKHWEFYDGNHAAISPTPGDESADKAGNPINTQLVDLINGRGVSMFNYVGHGWEQGLVSGNFNVEAVAKLRNTKQYPFLIAVACCAGNYTNNGAGDCLGEAWQRAGNLADGTPWGGVAGFFSSDFQSWSPPMEGQDGMNQMLIDADGISLTPSIGSLLAFGNARMIAAYAQGGELMADFWNPFADPTTMPRTRLPKPLAATHDAGLLIGQSELVVNSPVEGALVSLYWQGQTLAIGVIESGSATLHFPPLDNVGTLTITLTQFNHIPYQDSVTVAPASGPFVVNQTATLQDAGGNANGKADFGETLTYDLRLANVGVETATTIAASLSTSDPNVTLLDAEESYADLQPDSSLLHPAAFSFRVADLIEDGHVVNFNLKITFSPDKTYETVLPVRLQAPRLSVLSIKVSDLDGGDGDGRLESGEKATVRIKNANTGKAASLEAVGTLSTTSPWLTISGPAALDPLAAGSLTTEAVFSVQVSPNAPQVVLAQLDYALQAGDYSAARSFGPYTINPVIETFESKGFNQFPWTQSGDKPWLVTSPLAFTGAYSARSGAIGANQKSQMRMTLNFEADGTLSFARRVSCEDGYDFLVFYVDGVEMGRWTGEVAWSEVSYPVTSGIHQLLWSYEKDGLGQQGSDRAWVDDISMPPYKIVVSTEQPDPAAAIQAQVQPNPTAGSAWLRLQLPLQRQQISVEIWDLMGHLVALPMPPSSVPGGEMTQALELRDLQPGIYLVRVRTELGSAVMKLVKE
ncbi:MAG TPA: C25 family cysteine peptidase, partial [Saprospiraceae bacterium]|nr:C25 family cysteine peptidase [Saprospiraceae bacterium]